LGERLLCKQEVIGSIPFTSTSTGGGAASPVPPAELGMKYSIRSAGVVTLSLRFVD
jgi:hypothetical protein